MKATAGNKEDICPDCKTSVLVMGMSSGRIKIYGCLHCRNAQGAHLKMKDAKQAWEKYKEKHEKNI